MIRQLLTMILSVNLIIAGISPGSALSKVTFSGNQTYKAEQTQSADITGDSSQDPDSGDDKAAPETETTPETGATQEDGVSQATDTPATSTDDTAIEDDGADDLDADNQNGDSSGAEESEDSEEYADEFGEKAEEVDTIDSADEGFKKVKVEELIKDGFSPDDIDFVTDVCRRKLGFMAFTTGKLPYRDFPLRAVDWMMIPAVKINEIEELKNVVEPKDILNTSLYTQLFYVNWAQGHFHENKWDANELDEVIPNFKKAVKLVENRPRPKMWLTYDKARKNLRRVMKENAKVPDRNSSK